MYKFIRPVLFLLPAEMAHNLGLKLLQLLGFFYRIGWLKLLPSSRNPTLQTNSPFGMLSSPLGVAAGFDKNAKALWGWEALGFGFIEVGTATPVPQPGNPKPRLFRAHEIEGIVNRMGFNNDGAERIARRIEEAKAKGLKIKVGGNIGKNKSTAEEMASDDYETSAKILAPIVDYLVINVSSPNTPNLRALQATGALQFIVSKVKVASMGKPVFIKVAPDNYEEFFEGICKLVVDFDLAGAVCGNTLVQHSYKVPQGGLSGKPVLEGNLKLVRNYSAKLSGKCIIGVGGIFGYNDAARYFNAGASLIQVYSGLIYQGPKIVKNIYTLLIYNRNQRKAVDHKT